MCDHGGGVQFACGHELQRLAHVVRVAAAGAHDVVHGVVDVIEIHPGAERLVRGSGKEVEAPAEGENRIALFHHRRHGREHEYVVISSALPGQAP